MVSGSETVQICRAVEGTGCAGVATCFVLGAIGCVEAATGSATGESGCAAAATVRNVEAVAVSGGSWNADNNSRGSNF